MNIKVLNELYERELNALSFLTASQERWKRLERLHIIGQQFILKHYQVHILMLKEAINDKNPMEFVGQVMRLILVLPGHIFGRLPIGNIGSSRVSAFKKMEIPEDLKKHLNG